MAAQPARVICKRSEPLRLPASALSSTGQRIIAPAIDTVVVATGTKLAVTKLKVEGVGNGLVPCETTHSSVSYIETPLASDIESLDLHRSGSRVAAADASGHLSLLQVSDWSAAKLASANRLPPPFVASHGWTGVRFTSDDKLVAASFGGRYIALYDGDKIVNTVATVLRPAALCISEEGVVLVAEGNSLSAWDLRAGLAPVKRIRASHESLYALSTANQLVAVAGADRSVHVFDTRKWAARGHWSSCLKYAVTSVHFAQDPQACYVGGLDSELLCGQWSGKSASSHYDGFRADSRWVGIAKGSHEGHDYVAGCTERGSVYVLANSFGLYTAPKPRTAAPADADMD